MSHKNIISKRLCILFKLFVHIGLISSSKMKRTSVKRIFSSLILLSLIVSIFVEIEAKKKKKHKEDDEDEDGADEKKSGDGEEGEEENSEDLKKRLEKELEDLLNGWKNFKMPDEFGVSTFQFQDMQKCLSQSMKKGFQKHPDIGLNMAEVIEAHGYPVEKHKVQTSDEYKLTVFRIPYSNKSPIKKGTKKKAVYLNHGLGGNSHEWILHWNQRSLGYILADAGFDVWFGNIRGTRYARKHLSKTPKEPDYWDFSFDDIGRFDVPAIMDTILNVTGENKLSYIGHGLGSTAYVVAMTELPELNAKIAKGILLAPSVFLGHSKSFLKSMNSLANKAQYKENPMLGGKTQSAQEQLSQYDLKDAYNKACKPAVFHCFGCSSLYFTIGGFNGAETNYTMLPLIASLFPDKFSTKTLVHYAQLMVSGKFQRFDYGNEEENKKAYEDDSPPEYDLSKLSAPISIFYANRDYIAPPEDVEFTASKFPPDVVKDLVKVDSEGFTHGDFVTAIHAKELVYDSVLKILQDTS